MPRARYHMLVTSLPALPPKLDGEHVPIPPERLAARLAMLEPDDADEVARLRGVLAWGNQFAEANDAAVVKRYLELVAEVRTPLVRELLELGADSRMIAVALRARRAEREMPAVGYGPRAGHIRRHFKQPDLGLGQAVPWIAEAEKQLADGDLLGLFRKHVLGVIWDFARKRAQDHYFDFEAVVLYIARWDCVRRWQQLEPEKGKEIFEALVTETLGEYANVYP
jgi:hypothetical protein